MKRKRHGSVACIGHSASQLERASGALALVFLIVFISGARIAEAAGGRLLATGGVTQIEGAAGGGLVPWALIGGLGTRDEIGGATFATHVDADHFDLFTAGLVLGLHDRLELSFARQHFGLGQTVPGASIEQDIFGVKLRLFGDAVFEQDRWWPQMALGMQYKRNLDFDFVPALLGAKDDQGVDVYLAATKLYLAGVFGRNVLVNATVRGTRANQFGLLGFGGDRHDGYQPQFEGSVAVFLTDALAIGAELRTKPDNLRSFSEDDVYDIFAVWLPHKRLALTLAYADLGRIADRPGVQTLYVSGQVSF